MRFRRASPREVERHALFLCPCGFSVAWGSLATPAGVAAEERAHEAHGGLRPARRERGQRFALAPSEPEEPGPSRGE